MRAIVRVTRPLRLVNPFAIRPVNDPAWCNDAFSQSPLSRAFRSFIGLVLKGNNGSILHVRNFFPERSVLARLSLSAFDRNLAHWSRSSSLGVGGTNQWPEPDKRCDVPTRTLPKNHRRGGTSGYDG